MKRIESRVDRIYILVRIARAAGWVVAILFVAVGQMTAETGEPLRSFAFRGLIALALIALGQFTGWLLELYARRIIQANR
jgi:hypothetical protein